MKICALIGITLLTISSHASATPVAKCPYAPADLSQQLGIELIPVTQMQGLLGPACEYADVKRTVKVAVDAGPNPAPSAEMWRKMANPPGTKWKNIANDPDKAVILESYPNGKPYPAISYERKGWLVQINVMGIAEKKDVAQWNEKLLKLKRLPE